MMRILMSPSQIRAKRCALYTATYGTFLFLKQLPPLFRHKAKALARLRALDPCPLPTLQPHLLPARNQWWGKALDMVSSHCGLAPLPQTHQPCSGLRAFARAAPTNFTGLIPHLLQVSASVSPPLLNVLYKIALPSSHRPRAPLLAWFIIT